MMQKCGHLFIGDAEMAFMRERQARLLKIVILEIELNVHDNFLPLLAILAHVSAGTLA